MSGISPVGTWLDSNYGTQTTTTYPGAIDADLQVVKRIADRYAPHPAATPNMTVVVDAGYLFIGGTSTVENAQQTTTTFTAPTSNSRKDWIVADATTGVIAVVTGTPSASPAEPNIPNGKFPIAVVTLASTTTAITSSLISDRRVLPGASTTAPAVNPVVTSSGTFTNVASGIIPLQSGYSAYDIFIQAEPATNNVLLQGLFQDSISGDLAANYWSYLDTNSGTSSNSQQHAANDSSFQLAHAVNGAGSPDVVFSKISVYPASGGGLILSVYQSSWLDATSASNWVASGSARTNNANTLNGLKIRSSSGNITFNYRVVATP